MRCTPKENDCKQDKVWFCYTPPRRGITNRTSPVVALSVMSYRLTQGSAPRPHGCAMPQQEACKTRKPYPVRFSSKELGQVRLLAEVAAMPVSTYIRSRALGRRVWVTTSPSEQYLRREHHLADLLRLRLPEAPVCRDRWRAGAAGSRGTGGRSGRNPHGCEAYRASGGMRSAMSVAQ